jgi:hypothetical protein
VAEGGQFKIRLLHYQCIRKSPRLYRYLQAYFQLPSTRTLKHLLSKIPFECGLNKPVIENLKLHVESMDELDLCCTLIFDEVSLYKGVAVVRDSRADVELATSLEDRRSQQYTSTWRDIVECVLVFIFLFITAVFW